VSPDNMFSRALKDLVVPALLSAGSSPDELRRNPTTSPPRGGIAEARIRQIFQRPVRLPRTRRPAPDGAVLRHFVRFNLVGAMGVAVQLATLELFNRGLGCGELLATSAAVEVAVLHNFVWHERFTWVDRVGAESTQSVPHSFASQKLCGFSRSALRRLFLFNLTNGAISLAGNLVFMAILMNQAHLPLLAANLVAIGCCALLNFVISDRWVFRTGRMLRKPPSRFL